MLCIYDYLNHDHWIRLTQTHITCYPSHLCDAQCLASSFPSLNKSLLFYPTTPYKTLNLYSTHFYIMIKTLSDYQISIRQFYKYVLERLKCQYLFIWEKSIQGTSPFKVVFQGFSRHLQIQGRFRAFQGFKVVVATLAHRRYDLFQPYL